MPEMLDRLKAALAARYAIERELGSGGMATVWLARDLRYARPVAVKVLRPDLSAALGADRFLREIRITAQLSHPHILPLLDSGEADGLLYYVMPYVAGGSLRDRLRGGEAWVLGTVLPLARDVASALEYAHRQGIIHRDVKPENVLFHEGEPMVADFGIARAITSAGGDQLTRSGFPVGTPGYMSPEQAMGGSLVDARTDVFGLGCVVYELLVGDTPPTWPTDEALRVGRFLHAPEAHRRRLELLPGRVEQTLVRALAVHAPDRFHSPLAFVEALEAAAAGTGKLAEPAVHEVLRRAAELEAERPTAGGALSLGAVEQVAAEVGIPPEHVRAAAQEVVGHLRSSASRSAVPVVPARGGLDRKRRAYVVECEVGREVTAAEHATLLMEIQDALETTGHVTVLGGGLTWSSAPAMMGGMPWAGIPGRPEGRQVTVTMAPDGGRTRIRIEEQFGGVGGGAVAAPLVGGVAALGIALLAAVRMGSGEWAVLMPGIGVIAVGVLFGSKLYVERVSARRGGELAALADRLTARIAAGRGALPGPAAPPLGSRG
jgi:hypothetical protein